MTDTEAAPGPAPDTGARVDTWWRRHRSTLLLVVAGALAVAVAVGLTGERSGAAYDPDNPGRAGAQAVARVLDDQDVDVDVVRTADAFDAARVDADTTVLVTSTESLGASTVERLRAHAGDATVVLLLPPPAVTDAFGIDAGGYETGVEDRAADCSDADLRALLGDLTLTTRDGVGYPAATGCFYGGSGALLARADSSTLLLGAGDVLANSEILVADNAAIALRLLGQHDRLVWYVANSLDLTSEDAVPIGDLLPDWLRPGLWLLALAGLALLLWRGRRLGPLVPEPVPVVVKAIETTLSRGRLYRKVDDRGHAAAQLRASARRACAQQLRLPATSDADALVRDVAGRTGRPLGQVAFLLAPDAPVPPTDHDLIRLAEELATLEREVRRT